MNTRLALALDYLDHGYNPIPVIPGVRATPFKWKEFQDRWTTREEVLEWWGAHPEWNLALVCGAFTGLVAVDGDDDEAVRFCLVHLDPTPIRTITRRGVHFWYRHPGAGIHVSTKTHVHPFHAIDIRGDGGMITGIGSAHAYGHLYVMEDGCDLVPSSSLPVYRPEWFPAPKRFDAPSVGRVFVGDLGVIQRAERYLDACEGSRKGGRNANTFRVAASVVRDFGLSLEQGWALLSIWNTQRNDPPLPEDELRIIVRSCLQSGKRPLGGRLSS